MLNAIFRSIFGTKHERDVKRMRPVVAEIAALEPGLQALSDEALRNRTTELRQRLADGAELDDLLPEAFAAVREAARRTVHMRHFDVQMMGGMVLHSGKIAEMATGEGKTLVATLPAYLNALPGLGTHVVTVNDYLARRDAQWMGPIYHALGLSVGVIQHEMQYLYSDGAHHHFMNNETYEQVALDEEILGDSVNYLIPNLQIEVEFLDGNPISVELPPVIELTVVETAPELKGATVSNVNKPAKLETGVTIPVPPFIQEGDRIRVNPNEGRYLERAK